MQLTYRGRRGESVTGKEKGGGEEEYGGKSGRGKSHGLEHGFGAQF